MRGASAILRRLVGGRSTRLVTSSSSISENLILTSAVTATCSSLIFAEDATRLLFVSTIAPASAAKFQSSLLYHSRSYSSAPSSDAANVVSIESEEQFNDSLRKVQDESLPAIFYFTALWCGPCKMLSPVIGKLSEDYPHVTTYKIDIDKDGLEKALMKLNIHSVPTLFFYKDGKFDREVVGADVQLLKDTMKALYK